jgi:hypothetical protein
MNTKELLEYHDKFKEKVNALTGNELYLYSLTEKALISDIYLKLFNRAVKGCDSCYMDAINEICSISKSKIMELSKNEYALRAGALLHDKDGDAKKMASNHNITNELAEYHLRTNPGCEVYFTKLPDDWKVRCGREVKKPEPAKAPEVKPEPKPEIKPEPKLPDGDIDLEKEKAVAKIADQPSDNQLEIKEPKPKQRRKRVAK